MHNFDIWNLVSSMVLNFVKAQILPFQPYYNDNQQDPTLCT